MKKFISAILLIAMVLSTVACGNTQKEATSSSATATQVTSPKGEVRSYLTGEWVAKETNSKVKKWKRSLNNTYANVTIVLEKRNRVFL